MPEERSRMRVQAETETVCRGQLVRQVEGLHQRQVDPKEKGPRAGQEVRTASSHGAKLFAGPSRSERQSWSAG